jgi:HEAT repeats
VLKLICGAIDPKFVGNLVEFLIDQEINQVEFLDEEYENKRLKKEGLMNLLLAADCLSEVNTSSALAQTNARLLDALKHSVVVISKFYLGFEAAQAVFKAIIINSKENPQALLAWLKKIAEDDREQIRLEGEDEYSYRLSSQPDFDYMSTQEAAIVSIAEYYNDDPQTLPWLLKLAQWGTYPPYTHSLAAIDSIAKHYREKSQTLPWLQDFAFNGDGDSQWFAVKSIAKYYKNDPQTLLWLQARARLDDDAFLQWEAVKAITEHYKYDSQTLPLLKQCVQTHSEPVVRYKAIQLISENFHQEPGIYEFFCTIAQSDPFKAWEEGDPILNPRFWALKTLITKYPTHFKPLELLRDLALNDPDEQLREWAQQQLERQGQPE